MGAIGEPERRVVRTEPEPETAPAIPIVRPEPAKPERKPERVP
jgi:hypothetical protein